MLFGCPGQYLILKLEVLSLLLELPDVEAKSGAVLWFLVLVPSFQYLLGVAHATGQPAWQQADHLPDRRI